MQIDWRARCDCSCCKARVLLPLLACLFCTYYLLFLMQPVYFVDILRTHKQLVQNERYASSFPATSASIDKPGKNSPHATKPEHPRKKISKSTGSFTATSNAPETAASDKLDGGITTAFLNFLNATTQQTNASGLTETSENENLATPFVKAQMNEKPKVLLSWNIFRANPMDRRNIIGSDPYPQFCGEGYNCVITENRTYLESDAVYFYWPTMRRTRDDMPDPNLRKAFQKYVWYNSESAAYYPVDRRGDLDGFFNATVSYRLDSDVVYPYGHVVPRLLLNAESSKGFGSKTKLVAQFVSNCHTPSRREAITSRLKKYISVDVYGSCGEFHCKVDDVQCREILERDYFFYLGFENSLCRDYVTEKLFYQLQANIVPVVLSRKIASAVAPNDSFIAVDDFKTIKQLAEYLTYLAGNETAYSQYFEWKKKLEAKSVITLPWNEAMCPLCRALYNATFMQPQVVPSIYDWWTQGSSCFSMPVPDDEVGATLLIR